MDYLLQSWNGSGDIIFDEVLQVLEKSSADILAVLPGLNGLSGDKVQRPQISCHFSGGESHSGFLSLCFVIPCNSDTLVILA